MRYVFKHTCIKEGYEIYQGWEMPGEIAHMTMECALCGEKIAPCEVYQDRVTYTAGTDPGSFTGCEE